MTAYNFTAGKTGAITLAYFPTTDGSGPAAPTPGQSVLTSSDPATLELGAPTAPDVFPYTAHKGGTVSLTVAVPAATDTINSYSAFSGTASATVGLNTITIQSFTVTVS